MAETFSKLAQTELTAGGGSSVLVTGAAESTIVRHMRAVNNDNANDTTLKMWQTGTTDADVILPTATIDAGGWAEFEGTIILSNGETLHAEAGAGANITITVYGLELT